VFELNGLSVSTTFFKGTLDKLGIEPQIFRVGEFKSAIEPFTRQDMSEESRLQTASYVNSIYNTYLENVASARNIPVDQLRLISDSMKVQLTEDAVAYKLINQLSYYDEVLSNIREKIGVEEKEKVNFVSLGRYRKSLDPDKDGYSENRIAVIVASGIILSGEGGDNMIGSEKFAKEIRKARLDDKVKAVVLRINSGGGSALASDVIRREVALTAEVKPIIASMSDVAASGGYAIAMSCDTIVAHPNTITGSIGVFMLSFNLQEFLNSKLGMTVDRVNTGEFSDIMSQTRPATEQEMLIIQKSVNEAYDHFITQAAQDRNIPLEEMKQIAEGRVWSGTEAKDRKLVDVLGGMEDAIDIAVKSAGIEDDYRVRYYPEQKTWIEELLSSLETDMEARALKQQLGTFYPYVNQLKALQQMQGVQARIPFEIVIE
jgi:protease IV